MKSFIADKNRKLSKLALYNIEDLSYSAFNRALRKKDVKVNGRRVSEDVMLNVGDKVEIYYASTEMEKYSVLYVDENVLVVDKKSGYTSDSVYESVKQKYNLAGYIHRLDRNTDGLMIFSLNQTAEEELLFGFKNRTFIKKYLAWVVGVPQKKEQVMTAYLFKDSKNSTVTVSEKQVKGSVLIKTGYKLLKTSDGQSLLEVELFTGKTHQIRAHLAFIGHPIVGDGKYGDFSYNEKVKKNTQQLTAYSLTLNFNEHSKLNYLNGKTFTAIREY